MSTAAKKYKLPKKDKPTDAIKSAVDNIKGIKAAKGNSKKEGKYADQLSLAVVRMKVIVYGGEGREKIPEQAEELAKEIMASKVWDGLTRYMHLLEFEARKDLSIVFANMLRRPGMMDHIKSTPAVLTHLVGAYEDREVATVGGTMLRACLASEDLCRIVLYGAKFSKFFEYVDDPDFEISSDALTSFREVLSTHKTLVAEYLEKNYDEFMGKYKKLLQSPNYVTRRQSLKLLGELLLDRSNFAVMTRYISDDENLKLMMTMLRDKSKNIQFEAFHVFKVFVANPKKADSILEILCMNRDRLVQFLGGFHNDRDDDQFADEKAFLIKQIEQLPDP